jgi:hypothetical protein
VRSLESLAADVLADGPSRVVISAEGEATTSRRAREEHGITPDVVFLRGDGWSLGAPWWFESIAYREWADEWVGYMRRPGGPRPISLYEADR